MVNLEEIALEAFEKGKKDIYSPQDPFVAFGFENNPFLETPMSLLKNEFFLESRIFKISTCIANVISSFENKLKETKGPVILDGILYGSAHSGISTLLKLVHSFLSKESPLFFLDAKDFVVFEEDKYSISKTIKNLRKLLGNYDIDNNVISPVVIDHSDYLIDFFEDFRSSFERDFPLMPIIFVFTHAGWTRLKTDLSYTNYSLLENAIQSVMIDPLKNDEVAQMLFHQLSIDGSLQNPFTNDILTYIAQKSVGNLKNAIKLCVKLCSECYYRGLDTITESLVDELIYSFGFQRIKEFYDLITMKSGEDRIIKILTLISLKSLAYDSGLSYDEIFESTDIPKNTATHYLKQLKEKEFIDRKSIDRKSYASLRDEFKTLADTYLIQKYEQGSRYAKLEKITYSI
ncbi:MAG: helix-turn-helix transcriptional regulator [Asgard group archaeon]|nr:helix-turn-helix transcriptional regulator [Asgard group archaeon]